MSDIQAARFTLLFGASGLIGRALHRELGARGVAVRCVPWSELSPRLEDSPEHVAAWLLESLPRSELDVVFAGGLTDPRAPPADLHRSNVSAVKVVSAALAARVATRVLTLGSAMEVFPRMCAANAYLDSKRQLAEWVSDASGDPPAIHVRLHTIYGPSPRPHMFFGQMLESIRRGVPFRMSAGTQLREYHHADDIAFALAALLEAPSFSDERIVTLSSGQPVRLVDLATGVFAALGKLDLLEVGALGAAPDENQEHVFPPAPRQLLPRYRDPVAAIVAVIREQLRAV